MKHKANIYCFTCIIVLAFVWYFSLKWIELHRSQVYLSYVMPFFFSLTASRKDWHSFNYFNWGGITALSVKKRGIQWIKCSILLSMLEECSFVQKFVYATFIQCSFFSCLPSFMDGFDCAVPVTEFFCRSIRFLFWNWNVQKNSISIFSSVLFHTQQNGIQRGMEFNGRNLMWLYRSKEANIDCLAFSILSNEVNSIRIVWFLWHFECLYFTLLNWRCWQLLRLSYQ